MKKFLYTIIVFSCLFVSTRANAQITVVPESPQQVGTPIELHCPVGNSVYFFGPNFLGAGLCESSTSLDYARNYIFLECLSGYDCGMNLSQARLSDGYVSETNYIIERLPDETLSGGLFFGRDIETGKSKATDLTAMVGHSTQTTFKDIGPIAVIVLSIILAFVFIRVIYSLIYETGDTKNKNKSL